MKRILLPVFLLATLFSSSAFAAHAYRFESCKSSLYDLDYTGNYIIGGVYLFSQKDQKQDVRTYPLKEFEDDMAKTLEDADVLFNTVERREFDRQETNTDGWLIDSWKTETTIMISLIAPEASKQLGLKQGDKVTFSCEESIEYPNLNQYP